MRALTSRARSDGALRRNEAALEDEVRRRTAKQVERERAVLTQAEELAGAGNWEFDLRDGLLRWSAGMYRIRGRQPGAQPLTVQDATRDVHPEDRARVSAELECADPTTDDVRSSYRIVRPDHTVRHVETHARVLRDTAGMPSTSVGVAVDVTERREIEIARLQAQTALAATRKIADAEIRAARDEAQRANHAKSDFLSRISHELRTPLSAVLGFGQLLAMDEDLLAGQGESVEQILDGGRHLLALIDELLDIARIESGMDSVTLQAVDLTSALREAVDLIAPIASQSDITLRCDFDAACELRVSADRQRLRQIILNLLSNAVKYNYPGDVRLSVTTSDADRVLLTVNDSGPGIDPANHARVFEPFDRLHAEHDDVQGTGLGLALSRSLPDQMNGSLTVASQLERGAVFTLELDLAHPTDQATS